MLPYTTDEMLKQSLFIAKFKLALLIIILVLQTMTLYLTEANTERMKLIESLLRQATPSARTLSVLK